MELRLCDKFLISLALSLGALIVFPGCNADTSPQGTRQEPTETSSITDKTRELASGGAYGFVNTVDYITPIKDINLKEPDKTLVDGLYFSVRFYTDEDFYFSDSNMVVATVGLEDVGNQRFIEDKLVLELKPGDIFKYDEDINLIVEKIYDDPSFIHGCYFSKPIILLSDYFFLMHPDYEGDDVIYNATKDYWILAKFADDYSEGSYDLIYEYNGAANISIPEDCKIEVYEGSYRNWEFHDVFDYDDPYPPPHYLPVKDLKDFILSQRSEDSEEGCLYASVEISENIVKTISFYSTVTGFKMYQ